MAKVISVSNAVYKKLRKMKGSKSFSETIMELIAEKEKNAEKAKKVLLELSGSNCIDENAIKGLSKSWEKWSRKYA